MNILSEYLLGDDWYVSDPLGVGQVNTLMIDDILYKYSKRYRKEVKKYKLLKKINLQWKSTLYKKIFCFLFGFKICASCKNIKYCDCNPINNTNRKVCLYITNLDEV